MRFSLCFAVLLAVSSQAHAFDLKGEFTQGELLFGKVALPAKVELNGRELQLTAQGEFIFGLDRDEKGPMRLQIQENNQAAFSKSYPVKKRKYRIQRLTLPPDKVSPPPEVLARIAQEAGLTKAARQHQRDIPFFLEKFIWPATGPISGVFGSQRILNGLPKQPHYGVDVAIPVGTKVVAPAGGVITLAENDLYYTGGTLFIDHGHGLTSAFLHLSDLKVKVGDTVAQGDWIADSGVSGRATGPHLDWRVDWRGEHIDAQRLVPPMKP